MESNPQKNPKGLLHKSNPKARNNRTKISASDEPRNRDNVYIEQSPLFKVKKSFRR